MNIPKVSIIVPVYNVERYIAKCIDSILSQTFNDFECILVNDFSADNSGKICDEYAEKDKRIKVVHKKQNRGLPQARKTGFGISLGEYIQFVDSDDWIESDMVEALWEKTTKEHCDIITSDYFFEKDDTTEIIKQDIVNFDKTAIIKKILNNDIKAYVWNKFISRKLLEHAEFPIGSNFEDVVLTIQNICNANKIAHISKPFYHYCYNSQSISNNKENKIVTSIEKVNNLSLTICFLKKNYGELKTFEPELSSRVNKVKNSFFTDKYLRRNKELFKLYPESQFLRWRISYILKLFLKQLLPQKIISFIKRK